MGSRKSLSKKQRFEIFKRDSFTCQYCGRTPPEVILEVDHINPVINGGDNDPLNLITACFDCNRGKGAKELGHVAPKPDADLKWLETQQEICELRRYQMAKSERDNLMRQVISSLQDTWAFAFGSDYVPLEADIAKLLNSISPEIIEKAIYIASAKEDLSGSTYKRFKYVCGIAWNIVRSENGE